MKIVAASDLYEESLSVAEVAQATERGFQEAFPDAQHVPTPVADGGKGMVGAMIAVTQGGEHSTQVAGPLGKEVDTCRGMSGGGKTAFIEVAVVNGLTLVPLEKRNPLVTAPRGTGELVSQVLDNSVQGITIGIGGSATSNGDAGMVQTLGTKFCDANGTEVGYGGGSLMSLNSIDISGLDLCLKTCSIHVARDVANPLVGDPGTSYISGPQKGATKGRIFEPDCSPSHYADIIKKSLRIGVKDVPGSDAAGGVGAALMAFLSAELYSGTEIMAQALNPEEHTHNCMLVVTNEGRIDSQGTHGRVSVGVTDAVKKYHKPVIGISGSPTRDMEIVHRYGIDAVFSTLTSINMLEGASRGAFGNTYRASRSIVATLVTGMYSAG